MKWNPSNRKNYEEKGYAFTHYKESFLVKSEDLSPSSPMLVKFKCDYCKKEVERKNADYILGRKKIPKDCCIECKYLKVKESNDLIYGCHPNKLDENKEKRKQESNEKFGADSYTQTEDFKEKTKSTIMKKHGVEFYQQTQEYQDKKTATNLERFGVEHSMQAESVRQKRDATFMERYGVINPMHVPEFQQKMMDSLYKNGDAPSSSQQNHIHELIGGSLNYPFDRLWLDIAFLEDKIYFEYDGGGHDLQVKFGHITQDEFEVKERRRSFALARNGWKEIRLIARKDKLPEDFVIVSFTDKAKSFLIEEKAFSFHFDSDINEVLINYKTKISIDDFLSGNFVLEMKVS